MEFLSKTQKLCNVGSNSVLTKIEREKCKANAIRCSNARKNKTLLKECARKALGMKFELTTLESPERIKIRQRVMQSFLGKG
jgi:hypothetical protein